MIVLVGFIAREVGGLAQPFNRLGEPAPKTLKPAVLGYPPDEARRLSVVSP